MGLFFLGFLSRTLGCKAKVVRLKSTAKHLGIVKIGVSGV